MPNITNHLAVTEKTVTLHGNSAKGPVPYLKKNAFCANVHRTFGQFCTYVQQDSKSLPIIEYLNSIQIHCI